MELKTDHGTFEVREISFKQQRKLHRLNALCWQTGELDLDAYYNLLDEVHAVSGLSQRELDDLDDNQIDTVLQACFLSYKGLSSKKKR